MSGWIKCCRCKEPFMLHPETEAALRRSSHDFHCPWGHPQHFTQGETEAEKLRRERDRLQQQLAQRDDVIREETARADAAERSASAYKGIATRLKKRAAAGVCPCCNRQFTNLQRHMATKHAGFVAEEHLPEGATVQ